MCSQLLCSFRGCFVQSNVLLPQSNVLLPQSTGLCTEQSL